MTRTEKLKQYYKQLVEHNRLVWRIPIENGDELTWTNKGKVLTVSINRYYLTVTQEKDDEVIVSSDEPTNTELLRVWRWLWK